LHTILSEEFFVNIYGADGFCSINTCERKSNAYSFLKKVQKSAFEGDGFQIE